jgi:hypothetical protein
LRDLVLLKFFQFREDQISKGSGHERIPLIVREGLIHHDKSTGRVLKELKNLIFKFLFFLFFFLFPVVLHLPIL